MQKTKQLRVKTLIFPLEGNTKKSIKTAKLDGWKKFTSNIKFPSDVSKLITNFNNSKNNVFVLLTNKDGEYSDNPEESLNTMFKKIQAILRSLKPIVWTGLKLKTIDWTNLSPLKKVRAAFRHMGSFKLAGPDGNKPIVMKHFGPKALGCITKIYQVIYSTGYIPMEFRKSRVVFMPKPQKADYVEAGSFRPISLTQFLFKTME